MCVDDRESKEGRESRRKDDGRAENNWLFVLVFLCKRVARLRERRRAVSVRHRDERAFRNWIANASSRTVPVPSGYY